MVDEGTVLLTSISRPPPLFLWRSRRSAAHPGVFSGLVLLVSLFVDIVAVEESQQFSDFPLIPFAFHCISRRQLVGV